MATSPILRKKAPAENELAALTPMSDLPSAVPVKLNERVFTPKDGQAFEQMREQLHAFCDLVAAHAPERPPARAKRVA